MEEENKVEEVVEETKTEIPEEVKDEETSNNVEVEPQEQTAVEVVPVIQPKRSKKDIIGYNPETGEPIYKEYTPGEIPPKKKGKKGLIITIIILVLLIIGGLIFYFATNSSDSSSDNDAKKQSNKIAEKKDNKKKEDKKEEKKDDDKKDDKKDEEKSVVANNGIIDMDLNLFKQNTEQENYVYSPMSLKYVLSMLEAGTDGTSKQQIANVISDYKISKYVNSSNMNITNALFIKESYKDNIKSDYINKIKADYNADVVTTSFDTPTEINNYISEKTFNLINNMFDSISDKDFILLNTTAIDMEWKYKLASHDYYAEFSHVNYAGVGYNRCKNEAGEYTNNCEHFTRLKFNHQKDVNSLPIATVAFEYDIIEDLGEDNIRNKVKTEYQKYLDEGGAGGDICGTVDEYADYYIESLKSNYRITSSTDYGFYVDDKVKVFAKELKEYNGVTLQYVGIMPLNTDLVSYINNLNKSDITSLINKLVYVKPTGMKSSETPTADDGFKKGVVTEITGTIPVFKTETDLELISGLNKLGITDIFDSGKSNLSKLSTDSNAYISIFKQKTNIEFSNDGIKAAAATAAGGRGAVRCPYDYKYDVPVEKIDITFDKPYIYLIRNKDTGEVWFMGKVYNPIDFTE